MSHEAAAREAQVGSALIAENERLRAEVADLKTHRIVYSPDAKALSDRCENAEAERDRLRELLREARPYLNGLGWGKPGVDLPDRIDAALKEQS